MFLGKENCMKPNTTLSDYDLLENKLTITPEQNDYLMPLSYDAISEGMTYVDHNIKKIDTIPLKDKSDILPDSFGGTQMFPDLVYNEDPNTSFYKLMPGLPMDSYGATYSLSNDIPLRLSSPIQFNLSASLPNPTIEQLLPKKNLYPIKNTLNTAISPSSSNCGYESASPHTTLCSYGDRSNTFSPSLASRALSLSPISSATDVTTSKKKTSPKPSTSSSGIKRPLNSFMLYRRDKQSSIPTNNHQSISRIIGEMWKRETIEEKERYAEMALRERERHAKEYPDYKFLPKKKKDKNVNGKSPRKRKTYDPVLEQGESEILRMMLNQISHKKSQSDPVPFKIDQSNYQWPVEDKSKLSLKKTFVNSTNNATTNLSDNLLLSDTYKYPSSNVVPLLVFPTKNRVEDTGVYDSLDGFLNTFDNLGDHEIHTLMNNYSISSANELWLGNTCSRSCTGSPKSMPTHDIKDPDTFSKKNETQNIPLVPVFDFGILQDDIGPIQNSFTNLWDETTELPSCSPNPLDNQDLLSHPSVKLLNTGRINLINQPQRTDDSRNH